MPGEEGGARSRAMKHAMCRHPGKKNEYMPGEEGGAMESSV